MAIHLPNPFPGMQRPALTPLWNEAGFGIEAANLLRSRVFRGEGVHRGDGRGVLMIPGFLAGDNSMSLMTNWLRRCDYHTSRAGMFANVDCSQKSVDRIAERMHHLADKTGGPIMIVGQSRGGTMARVLAVQHPELVSGIVTLGSPLEHLVAVNPVVQASVFAVGALGLGHVPGFFSPACWGGECCHRFRDDLDGAFPAHVGFTSIYSKRDGIVDWHSCLDPAADHVEVRSSHCGMSVDAATFRAISHSLHAFEANERAPLSAPGLRLAA